MRRDVSREWDPVHLFGDRRGDEVPRVAVLETVAELGRGAEVAQAGDDGGLCCVGIMSEAG